jgi:hypothetical protein
MTAMITTPSPAEGSTVQTYRSEKESLDAPSKTIPVLVVMWTVPCLPTVGPMVIIHDSNIFPVAPRNTGRVLLLKSRNIGPNWTRMPATTSCRMRWPGLQIDLGGRPEFTIQN